MTETLKSLLMEVHNYNENDQNFTENMDTARKRYSNLKKEIAIQTTNLDSYSINEIYKYINAKKESTLKEYVKELVQNPKLFNSVLLEQADKQSRYYYENLYMSEITEQMKKHSMSDTDIAMQEYFIKNCVPLKENTHHQDKKSWSISNIKSIEQIDININDLEEKIDDFFEILELVLDTLKVGVIDPIEFGKNLEHQKKCYLHQKINFNSQINISTNNAHMLFYLYLRNAYVLNVKFKNKLPNIYEFEELDFEKFTTENKPPYKLSDISRIYASITIEKIDSKKLQGSMKKQFQNSEYMKGFKKENGRYEFEDAKIPIAHYHYYKKKNHPLNGESKMDVSKTVQQLTNVIELYLTVSPELMKEIIEYIKFVDEEFREIFKSQSTSHQLNLISLLTDNMGNALFSSFDSIKKNGENSF